MLGHYLSPYDNDEFSIAVAKGDKSNGTDIHTINQRKANLSTRDEAKTLIYATIYGAGATKIGNNLWKDNIQLNYTLDEFNCTKSLIHERCVTINNKLYFPISKTSLIPYTDTLVEQTIYGNTIFNLFKNNTKGYAQLLSNAQQLALEDNLKGLDDRQLHPRSPHSALNLLLQSAGAIFMKYLLVDIESRLANKYTQGIDYIYVANIHKALWI